MDIFLFIVGFSVLQWLFIPKKWKIFICNAIINEDEDYEWMSMFWWPALLIYIPYATKQGYLTKVEKK